jgi:hypothetical protein
MFSSTHVPLRVPSPVAVDVAFRHQPFIVRESNCKAQVEKEPLCAAQAVDAFACEKCGKKYSKELVKFLDVHRKRCAV